MIAYIIFINLGLPGLHTLQCSGDDLGTGDRFEAEDDSSNGVLMGVLERGTGGGGG